MEFKGLKSRLYQALKEDGALGGGVTTSRIPGHKTDRITVRIVAKQVGIFCGGFLLNPLFRILDPKFRVLRGLKDGRSFRKGQVMAVMRGTVSSLLWGERTFLNLACRLSGVATLTHRFVSAVRPSKVAILSTRKTTPLWRDLEKYAVRCGGGQNHRTSLKEAVLIKDNHLAQLRLKGLTPMSVYGVGKQGIGGEKGIQFVELEAHTYRDVWDGIKIKADVIMLDNMPMERLKRAIVFIQAARRALRSRKPLIEISGGITLKNVRRYARTGADRISVGALTHSAPSVDLSMEVLHGC